MKSVILLLILFLPFNLLSQTVSGNSGGRELTQEQEEPKEGIQPAPVTEYKIISIHNDTTFVDTSLTIHKEYKFNYLRKDNFELLPFPNVGQTYNKLAYDFMEYNKILPRFGARARHFNFMEVEDIYYYQVPTPFTELYFKTVFEQGQTLDALFTINTSKNINFSIAYKGLRSLGTYQHMLTSTGNFRATLSYNTSNQRYHLKTHFVSQDLMNQENGGLTERSLENFLSRNPEFEDRSRLDVRFQNAQSTLYGKRFFLDHSLILVGSEHGSLLSVGHRLNYTYKKFEFQQEEANNIFGPSFEEVGVHDETRLESIYNEGYIEFSENELGRIKLKGAYTHYNYGYNTVLDIGSEFIENRLIGDVVSAGASYLVEYGNFRLMADGMFNVSGELNGYNIEGNLKYAINENMWTGVRINLNDRAPNWNFLLYQSDYVNYNWQNDFSNLNSQSFEFRLEAPRWLDIRASYTMLGNYTYFGADENGHVSPYQHDRQIKYAKVKAIKNFEFGKFALANTVLFQKVKSGNSVINVPTFITRNSFYYQDHWFKKALYVQSGFTVKYFPSYKMDAYDPILAEFYVQNAQEYDDHGSVDFFFNGKVRRTRIFFKLERLDALLLGNSDFSAPLYPYRDFGIRFGLVWNFFM